MSSARLVAVLAAVGFVVPAAAHAAPEEGMGCPQGYTTFDAQRGGGGPPSYLPGETVTASGYLTDAKAKAAPSVTLRWGSPEGAAVGQAAIDSEGSWKGMTFVIPESTPHETYKLYLEARDADGEMLPGLPIPTQLRVGPPVTTRTGGQKQRESTLRPESFTKPEAVASPKTTTRLESPAQPEAITRSSTSDLPRTTTVEPEPAGLYQAQRSRALMAAAGAVDRAASKGAGRRLDAPFTGRGVEGAKVITAQGARAEDGSTSDSTTWPLGLVALLGFLALVAVFLKRRAIRIRARPRPIRPLAQAADLLIEAELQEMIAEHRAREAAERASEPAPFS